MKHWRNFKVEALGIIYLFLTAILAVKNNLRISFGEVYIAEKNLKPKSCSYAKIPLELQSTALCRHLRNWPWTAKSQTELHIV